MIHVSVLHFLLLLMLTVGVSLSSETTTGAEQEEAVDIPLSPPPQTFEYVTKLEDSTFEHLTQASTGGTTGSWLVYFHDSSPDDTTPSMTGSFPSEQEFLNVHVVVGSLDVDRNPKTRARFRTVNNIPSFVYLHRKKMYSFQLRDWDQIMAFVLDPPFDLAENIPPPQNLLDKLSEHWDTFHEHPNSWLMLGMFVSFAFLSCLARLVASVGDEEDELEDTKKQN